MSDLPRVTSIIQASGLMPSYPAEGNYLELGAAVDIGCRYLFKGYPIDDLEDIDERVYPYLLSLSKWLAYSAFKAVRIQQEWKHPAGYIGHPDADDGYLLIDTKTGSPAKHYKLQTAGYFELGRVNGIQLKKRGCLYLKKDGEMARLDIHADRADWQAFLSAFKLYQGEKELEQYRENLRRWAA